MLNQIELISYVVVSVVLLTKAMRQPIWAVAYYMLNFFAQPDYWSWGEPLTNPGVYRWSLFSGCFLVVVTLLHPTMRKRSTTIYSVMAGLFLVLELANAAFVHVLAAYDPVESYRVLVELAKFVVLYFVMVAAVRTQRDFFLLLVFLAVGLGYWGFEAKFVGMTLENGRLEEFGGPGCANSNELASITASLLPLVGCLLFMTRGFGRLTMVFISGLVLNILMLCNSRGGFLSVIASVMVLATFTLGAARKYAFYGLATGALAALVLAGDPRIASRFLSTFDDVQVSARAESGVATPETGDVQSKKNRIVYWSAAMNLLGDSPFGNGGNCFEAGMGDSYIAERGLDHEGKSCHQGFLEIAMAWGIQGLFLQLGFIASACLTALKVSRFQSRIGNHLLAFAGICILSGFSSFLCTSLFNSVLHLEWGYWLGIAAITYAKIYGEKNYDPSGGFPTSTHAGPPESVFVGAQ